MRVEESFTVGEYITVRKSSDSGVWWIAHPDKEGNLLPPYSTGIKGGRQAVREFIKEAKIKELVETGIRTKLSQSVIEKILGAPPDWDTMIQQWEAWSLTIGNSQKTVARQLYELERWLAESKLKSRPIRKIKPEHIHKWINRTDTDTKHVTRSIMLQSIRSFFKWACANGYTESDPTSVVVVRKDILRHTQLEAKPIKAFTKAEVDKLLSHLRTNLEEFERNLMDNPYRGQRKVSRRNALESRRSMYQFWYAAVQLSYGAGLRRSDIALLEWAEIGQGGAMPGWIVIHTEKTEARIAIPYSRDAIAEHLKQVEPAKRETVQAALEDSAPYLRRAIDAIEVDDLTYCFPEQAEIYNSQATKLSIYFTRILKDVGIHDKTFHSLRHSRIQKWKRLGLELKEIGKLVGHRNTSTTEGYLGET